jgi:hypothetical protein
VVELVDAVISDEPGEGFGDECIVMWVRLVGDEMGVGEGAADQDGGSVADVAGDDGLRQGGAAIVGEHGVDGVGEIDLGVDEGAVEVEDEEVRGAMEHGVDGSGWEIVASSALGVENHGGGGKTMTILLREQGLSTNFVIERVLMLWSAYRQQLDAGCIIEPCMPVQRQLPYPY